MAQPEPRTIVLSSWKEIAAFLKCGIRTAQRWERNEELPVHRHIHQRRGTVYAYANEIDTWLKGRESPSPLPTKQVPVHVR
jgi:hypothetical protein